MTIALAIPALLGLLGGQALPAGMIAAFLPSQVIGAAQTVDATAATIAAYAPAVCAATDGPLDRITDAVDASYGSRVTVWRRILVGLTAAADAVCANASNASTPLARAKIVVAAISAVGDAEKKLTGVSGASISQNTAINSTPHRAK